VRVPATFKVRGRLLVPRSISVPAFLAVQLRLVSADGRPHVLVLRADRAYRLRAPAGGAAALRIRGQRAGTYPVAVDGGAARGSLVAGGEPGP
jgi:hypothetical protein